ncbi:MAG: tRNA (adenosine(37)-N6)-threonylcarbamoyltransferase complex transferase subunit TsaD [Candidatus Riflebacteria bacterium RBG_13_59_9]|nr:MAG: tRNA (adenosine(37)-N6)-threonylcarbamoyltransferase complex transferase subunit TsaD [Candidatus Riflebacteria bacterium RBG_13_59_9]
MLLAIETSFDDTGLALLSKNCAVAASALSSSVELHMAYGGVVPEIAAREHLTNLPAMMADLRDEHSLDLARVSAVGVTRGPGLPGCLLAGVAFAKGLAYSLDAELYGLSHLEGHLYSPFFSRALAEIPFPLLGLVVSGGSTVLYLVRSFTERSVIGETVDDAAGELFDKVCHHLGYGYPGGARLEKLAREYRARPIRRQLVLPVPMRESGDFNFSFSGLKTAAVRMIDAHREGDAGFDPEFSASLMRSVWESVWLKVESAARAYGIREVSVSGGVAINGLLREYLRARGEGSGLRFHFPEPRLAMDNAEMMAYLLWLKRGAGVKPSAFDIDSGLT